MAQETINNSETFGVVRGKINNNFTELYTTKQANLALTTTGTSGPATLVGNALNIPNYAPSGGGGQADLAIVRVSNSTELLASIGSNRVIYLLYGTYSLTSSISLSNISNLHIIGTPGTTITTTVTVVFQLQNSVSNVTIKDLKLVTTRNSTTESDDGLISIYNFGNGSANITDVLIENIDISAPNSFQNGIKLIAQNLGLMSRIKIKDCKIHDIPRLGIEFQNSVNNTPYSYSDYEISGNYLWNIATNQTGLYNGVGISVMGNARNGLIHGNHIWDVLSTPTGKTAAGIENANNENVTISNNTITSKTGGFTGIIFTNLNTQLRRNCAIIDNYINLAGTESGELLIQGIQTFYAKGLKISGNTVRTAGYGIYLFQSSENTISDNDFYSTGTRVLSLAAGCVANRILNNTIDNTGATSNDGLILYNGTGNTGNIIDGNVFRMKNNEGGYAQEFGGASGNQLHQFGKIRTVTTNSSDILPSDRFLLINVSGGTIFFHSPGDFFGGIGQEVWIKNISAGTLTVANNIATGSKTTLAAQESVLYKSNGTSWYSF